MTTCKRLLSFLPGLALILTIAAPAGHAASVSTNSFADAFVTTGPTGSLSANNYGKAGALGLSAPGDAKGEFQSVLGFHLGGALTAFNNQYGAGQWTVQSLTLQLTATPTNNAIFNATTAGQFHISLMENNSWSEGTGTPAIPTTDGITYNTLQRTYINNSMDEDLGTFSFNGASSGPVTYSLDLPADLVSDVLAGGDISLRLYAADSSVSYLFNSKDFGTAASRPLLTITATPEPGTLALCGLGFTAMAGGRRFRSGARRSVRGDFRAEG